MAIQNTTISRPAYIVICDFCSKIFGSSEYQANGAVLEDVQEIINFGWTIKSALIICPVCISSNKKCPKCDESIIKPT